MKTTRNLKKARELVENFKRTYQKEIGLPIIVFACYNEEMTMEILSLNDLKEIADELVQIKKSILDKTRKKEVMIYKHIFCKVAKEMGYTFSYIGNYLKIDHSTVIHSVNKINDLLDVESKEHVIAYSTFIEKVKEKIENGRAVQYAYKKRDNSQPIVHAALS